MVLFCCFSRFVLVSREVEGKREGKAGRDFVSVLPSLKAGEKVDIFCSGVLRAREEPPKEAAPQRGEWRGGEAEVPPERRPCPPGCRGRAVGPQEAPAAASPTAALVRGEEMKRTPEKGGGECVRGINPSAGAARGDGAEEGSRGTGTEGDPDRAVSEGLQMPSD